MKSLNNSSVDAGGAGAGVGSRPGIGSRPSVGAGDQGVNQLDKLATLGVPSIGGAGGSARR